MPLAEREVVPPIPLGVRRIHAHHFAIEHSERFRNAHRPSDVPKTKAHKLLEGFQPYLRGEDFQIFYLLLIKHTFLPLRPI